MDGPPQWQITPSKGLHLNELLNGFWRISGPRRRKISRSRHHAYLTTAFRIVFPMFGGQVVIGHATQRGDFRHSVPLFSCYQSRFVNFMGISRPRTKSKGNRFSLHRDLTSDFISLAGPANNEDGYGAQGLEGRCCNSNRTKRSRSFISYAESRSPIAKVS